MYTFRELQKAAKKKVDGKEVRIAVLGNCATQFFSNAVQGYSKKVGMNVNLYDADYNQIDAQLLDRNSEVLKFEPDNIILWLGTEKIYEEFLDINLEERNGFADMYIKKILHYWELIEKNSHARIIQLNFCEIDDKVMGNYSCKVESTFIYQIRKLNFLLQEKMKDRKSVYPVDILSIQIKIGERDFYDAPLYYNAKMNVSINALPYLAKAVVDVLVAINGNIKKCVICDLDNTLWGGIIGDDGMGGIQIGELGAGHAFTNLQRWIKQLKEYGIILAICSKNNEDTAKEPFECHEEMVLRMNDIALFVANWNDKATNIKMIQKGLNIGMDSIIFLDDNSFERNLVRNLIPEIEVPELPEDPALYLEYIQEQNYFETASYTGENMDRTKQYQAEFQRKKLELSFTSIDDYLKSLNMIGTVNRFEPMRYARIAQLTQRSNQFNLRTIRYTEDEIEKIAEDESYIPLYYTLQDKFGEHGLVSVLILQVKSDKEVFIDTWLMSCRVLKRGMEEFIINEMVEIVGKNGYEKISAEYIPTSKNKMVEKIYEKMGFSFIGENHYELYIKNYKKQNVFILKED